MIKYIDNNLVWNKDNEVFAYYELIPYNYSFLSAEQKFIVHDSFRQLIAQSREGKIHALQIATESSIRSMQEQSKKLVTGKLKKVAYQQIDEQTEALVSMIGDNQVDYYVLGNVIEPIGRDYIYSELVNPIFIKDGDNVKVKVAVKFIDNQTKATQVSQYELVLHKDSNWKIVG